MESPEDYFKSIAKECDRRLISSLPQFGNCAALQYATENTLAAGGKRFRAALAIFASDLLGCDRDQAWQVAMAIELIHAYSLVHDDLPAMDDADLRRGQTTAHLLYGEGEAILLGDVLLTLGFEVLSEMNATPHKTIVRLIKELAIAAGGNGMVGGQWLDIASNGKSLEKSEILLLQEMKTGALISYAAASGGYLAEKEDETKLLASYGKFLGAAFQIADDLLDVLGETGAMGKNKGGDDESDKNTIVKKIGIAAASELAKQCSVKAKQELAKIEFRKTELSLNASRTLNWLADYSVARKK